eukprot:Opistho-1_new@105093
MCSSLSLVWRLFSFSRRRSLLAALLISFLAALYLKFVSFSSRVCVRLCLCRARSAYAACDRSMPPRCVPSVCTRKSVLLADVVVCGDKRTIKKRKKKKKKK